jgi:hypothetical protein
MHTISGWARDHKWTSRFLIIGIHIVITLLALYIGRTLQDLSFPFSQSVFWVAMLLFIATAACYPDKRTKKAYASASVYYIHQKTCDFLLPVFTFLMVCFIGNSPANLVLSSFTSQGSSLMQPAGNENPVKIAEDVKPGARSLKLSRTERKALIRKLKTQIKQAFQQGNEQKKNRGTKIALVVLASLVSLGLLYLVAALACSLSCNGSEAGAILVLVFGISGVVTLFIVVIKAIFKVKPAKPVNVEEPVSAPVKNANPESIEKIQQAELK